VSDQSKNIKVANILLIKSEFERNPQKTPDTKENVEIKIQVGRGIEESTKNLISEVTIEAIQPDKLWQAKIKMVGIFEQTGLSEEEQQNFLKINAPAIVFPFVREHLALLTMKSGITPLMISPVNFVALSKESTSTEKEIPPPQE
jgi:preprotein translocase subunit SecB